MKQPTVPEGFWTDVSMLPPPETNATVNYCARMLRRAATSLIAEEPSTEVRHRVDAALVVAPSLVKAAIQGGGHS